MNIKEKYGDWAVITGASSGIGREFARYLANLGINLIIIARRIERLKALADEVKGKNKIEVIPVNADLTKEESIREIIVAIGNREIGILINNAGVGSIGYLAESDLQKQTDLVKLNCLAPTILTHHILKGMVDKRKGAIIFLGSVVGMQPTPYLSVYSATKSFNIFLANALWYELKNYNIDVLALSPGSTDTEFDRVSKDRLLTAAPEDVVRTAFRSLGKKPNVVHGFVNKILMVISKLLPDKLTITLAGRIADKRNRISQ
jgi:uncharacterized protein